MGLLVPKKENLHWIKVGYVLFKEFNLATKIMSNCILDLVIVRYTWEKINNFDGSAKKKNIKKSKHNQNKLIKYIQLIRKNNIHYNKK